jgi:hypothetical protein
MLAMSFKPLPEFYCIACDVGKSAVFGTALASGRGSTANGEKGRGVCPMAATGRTPYFSWS